MFHLEKTENVVPLLYVYAKKPCSEPVNDEITLGMEKLWQSVYNKENRGAFHNSIFVKGMGTLGVHRCVCGEVSENVDYLIDTPTEAGVINAKVSKKDLLEKYKEWFDTIEFVPKAKTTKETILAYVSPKYATNTLCIHYLRYHRDEIPEREMKKIRKILTSAVSTENPPRLP